MDEEDRMSDVKDCTLTIPFRMFTGLRSHLFPGDDEEHAAVILAGTHTRRDGTVRLLARHLYLARDNEDWIRGEFSYNLHARFINKYIDLCVKEDLVCLFIHNHFSGESVGFSSCDLQTHERNFPALLDIMKGLPVGGLVFGRQSIAGDIWFREGEIRQLSKTWIVGDRCFSLTPEPVSAEAEESESEFYDRQVRAFGRKAQKSLRRTTVGIVGLGGVGSVMAELLGRLGVGGFVLIDAKTLKKSNLPRLIGATKGDLYHFRKFSWLARKLPAVLQSKLSKGAASKVWLAERNIKKANPDAKVKLLQDDVCTEQAIKELLQCDYIFLAADSHRARLLVNAMAFQYFIPAVQVGSRFEIRKGSGEITDAFSVSRKITPDSGCLWCSGVISPAGLTEESKTDQQREDENYGLPADGPAPSVITLNAVGSSEAVNHFLFYMHDLIDSSVGGRFFLASPMQETYEIYEMSRKKDCPFCGQGSRSQFGRGNLGRRLPY